VTNLAVQQLLTRSNTLGADPRNTNYAGGNTSAAGTDTDPVTGHPVELLWVKGSGGDLGTLTESGLAVLRLDRLRALVDVYPGVEREDEMVAAFDYCLHGRGGAAPSIDTAMHGLVPAAHVDHLHPDSGIALATAVDGEELTRRCYGDRVVWVPWRRPGFQLGLDITEVQRANPNAIGCILGGHGVTAWAETSAQCQANSLEIIRTAEDFLTTHGRPDPFGDHLPDNAALPGAERRARAAALFPLLRGLASTDRSQVGHLTDSDVVLDFLASSEHPRLAALGTSCPDHFLRTKVRPMVLDLPPNAPLADVTTRLRELHVAYRAEYADYYARHAAPDSPAMRGADPAIVLVPGVGMFSFGATKQTARVAGEFYVNAINVMRGAESVSTYAPIDEAEKFRIEYWALEEAKLARMPKPKPLASRVALVTGAASGIGRAIAVRLAAEGACVVVADLDLSKATAAAAEIGTSDVAIGVCAVATAFADTALAFGGVDLVVNNAGLSISKPLLETTERDWDLHDFVPRRIPDGNASRQSSSSTPAGSSGLFWSMVSTTWPLLPSTMTRAPSGSVVVASGTASTAGRPCSRATMAAWESMPPVSVITAAATPNSGVQAGSVVRHTRMSPGWTRAKSPGPWMRRTGPVARPGLAGVPVRSAAPRAGPDGADGVLGRSAVIGRAWRIQM